MKITNRLNRLTRRAQGLIVSPPRRVYAKLDYESQTVMIDGQTMSLEEYHEWRNKPENEGVTIDSNYPWLSFFADQSYEVFRSAIPTAYELAWDGETDHDEYMGRDPDKIKQIAKKGFRGMKLCDQATYRRMKAQEDINHE